MSERAQRGSSKRELKERAQREGSERGLKEEARGGLLERESSKRKLEEGCWRLELEG